MSLRILAWAMRLTHVNPVTKLAAIALADIAEPEGRDSGAFGKLVEFCCATPDEVVGAFQELAVFGVECDVSESGSVLAQFPLDLFDLRPREPNQTPCDVYVIASLTRTKIGVSSDPVRRLEWLQRETQEPLRLVWSASAPRFDVFQVERAAHRELAEHCIKGEWFNVSAERAIEAVRKVMLLRGYNAG